MMFNSYIEVKNHREKAHEFHCEECQMRLQIQADYDKHCDRVRQAQIEVFPNSFCFHCETRFMTYFDLKRHRATNGSTETCQSCKKDGIIQRFSNVCKFLQHRRAHEKRRPSQYPKLPVECLRFHFKFTADIIYFAEARWDLSPDNELTQEQRTWITKDSDEKSKENINFICKDTKEVLRKSATNSMKSILTELQNKSSCGVAKEANGRTIDDDKEDTVWKGGDE